ncbi:hypothetical protein GGH94_001480 [Coemansia aciculifera]|uniref:Uncharacterized protein n=1 Tax=Coemansia aciculifera TaxID=417176 RepID=A0A9W8ILM2_9FUNG|nr:hypothetical protein GGH94_001480 [Coemansia aciculifera]
MEGTDKYWELQKPLLWICHNFRDVVYPDVFSSRMLVLYSSQHNMFSLLGNRPQTYGQFDSSTFHLTKELAIEIDMWDVLTGRILELLSPRICKSHAFPQADTIKLIFSVARDKLENLTRLPGDATAKVSAFVRRIQKMAPAAHDIAVVAFMAYQKLPPPVKSHFVDLLAQLYQTATRITHNYPEYHVFKSHSWIRFALSFT